MTARSRVSLTGWLTGAVPGRGLHLAGERDDWTRRSYEDLGVDALVAATELRAAGVRRGDVVCVVLPTDFACLAAFFGVWAAGATLCPIVPPMFADEQEYAAHVAAILARAEPAAVVTNSAFAPLVHTALRRVGRPDPPLRLTGIAEPGEPSPPAEIALLQFTSGSTGTPRGVRVTAANLDANIGAIQQWLRWEDGEGVASWLPLHHDMGLIGCLLVPLTGQNDLWLMRPDQFIRNPARWITCFGDGRARHTAAPAFGYAYAARRLRAAQLAGLDFSSWKNAIVGAEHVDARALDSFLEMAGPRGFRAEAFAPAYGLAEATLAVTGRRPGEPPPMAELDWRALKFGAPVVVERTAVLGERRVDEVGWLVGCGTPRGDARVSIIDEAGEPLPEGHLGEISVRSPCVAAGYHGAATGGSTAFVGEALHTGDAGFLREGQLYVVGRMGDSLKVRGRAVYMEDLEAKVVAATRLSKWRCVVVGSMSGAGAGVAVLVEAVAGDWVETAAELLDRELGGAVPITVIAGRSGLIQRTTSGKPRRRVMWQQFQAGAFAGLVIAERHQGTAGPVSGSG